MVALLEKDDVAVKVSQVLCLVQAQSFILIFLL